MPDTLTEQVGRLGGRARPRARRPLAGVPRPPPPVGGVQGYSGGVGPPVGGVQGYSGGVGPAAAWGEARGERRVEHLPEEGPPLKVGERGYLEELSLRALQELDRRLHAHGLLHAHLHLPPPLGARLLRPRRRLKVARR